MMTAYLALRGIGRNKKNSLLIVLLIAVITFLFFIGNSVIGLADRSLREAYVSSLTGDVVIQKAGDLTMNLFGANVPIIDAFFTLPVLPAYGQVLDLASSLPGVAGAAGQVSGGAYLDLLGVREAVPLCGVDPEAYFPLFPGIILDEGRFPRTGEFGAMITAERADRLAARTGTRPQVGTPLLFTSAGETGFKLREVPLTGIYHYRNPGQLMNEIVIADPQTVRILNSIQVASSGVDVDEAALGLLDTGLDDLFGALEPALPAGEGTPGFSTEALHAFLTGTPQEGPDDAAGGDWHFIILRLEEGVSPGSFIPGLNKLLEPWGVRADGWRTGAGTSAMLLLLVQGLFNAGVALVSVAGIITAINILLISVFRRTGEIGTLRAIGASDACIRRLILGENLILALAAGCAGVLGGCCFLGWINGLDLALSNSLIAGLLGGPVLRVEVLPSVALLSFAVAAALGFFASLYPVEIAVRIDPMAAVRRG